MARGWWECFYWISPKVPWNVGEMALSQSKSLTTLETVLPSKFQPILLIPQQELKCRVGQGGFQRAGQAECQRVTVVSFLQADVAWSGLIVPPKKMAASVSEGDLALGSWWVLPHASL